MPAEENGTDSSPYRIAFMICRNAFYWVYCAHFILVSQSVGGEAGGQFYHVPDRLQIIVLRINSKEMRRLTHSPDASYVL
ncbi:leucine-rich repeat-containing protein 40-like X4, partial [Biomphalaria pfeifferi]